MKRILLFPVILLLLAVIFARRVWERPARPFACLAACLIGLVFLPFLWQHLMAGTATAAAFIAFGMINRIHEDLDEGVE